MTDHSDIAARADKAAAKRRARVGRLAFCVAEAANLIGRDPATLHRWIAAGYLRATHVGRATMISKGELDRLLAEGGPPRRKQARAADGKFGANGGAG